MRKRLSIIGGFAVAAVALLGVTPAAATTQSGTGWEIDGRRGGELALPVQYYGFLVVPGSRHGLQPSQATTIDPADFGLDSPLGTATSGDVDGDGRDDIVTESMFATVGGRDSAGAVAVIPGRDGDVTSEGAYAVENPHISRYFGSSLVVDDLDRDGYADAAAQSRGLGGTHTATVLWGGADGLSAERSTTYALPGPFSKGSGMQSGNLDGDADRELVVLRPGRTEDVDDGAGVRGRMTVCDVDRAQLQCRDPWRVAKGIDAAVVADVVGGSVDDIVLGQPRTVYGYKWKSNRSRVWVYRGTRQGVATTPTKVTQNTKGVPGRNQPSDLFGTALAADDLDGDGKHDLVVGAPGERKGGAVTVLYGHRRGLGRSPMDRRVSQSTRGVPGAGEDRDAFGESVALIDVDGNGRADLVVGAPWEENAWGRDAGAVTVIRTGADGQLRPRRSQQIEPDDVGIPRADHQLFFGWELPY